MWYTRSIYEEPSGLYAFCFMPWKAARRWKILSLLIPSIGIRRFPAERTALEPEEKIQVETVYGSADVKVYSYKEKKLLLPGI